MKNEIEEMAAKAAAAIGASPEDVVIAHVTLTPAPCDHEWDNGGCNPEQCLKCGMSFTRYIFTECP
jgi:hypothetical protein